MRLREETHRVGSTEKKLHLPEAIWVTNRAPVRFDGVQVSLELKKPISVLGQQLNCRKVGEIHQAEAVLWVSGNFHLSLPNPSRFHTPLPGADHTRHINLKALCVSWGPPVNRFHFSSPWGTTSDNAASHEHCVRALHCCKMRWEKFPAAARSLLLDTPNREGVSKYLSKYLGPTGHAVFSPAQQLYRRQQCHLVVTKVDYAMSCRDAFASLQAIFLALKCFL